MMTFEALRLDKTASRAYVDTQTDTPFEALSAQQLGANVPVVPGNYLPAALAGAAVGGAVKYIRPIDSLRQLRLVRRTSTDGPVSTLLALAAGAYAAHKTRAALNAREERQNARER